MPEPTTDIETVEESWATSNPAKEVNS